jgi:predicted RNA binding protein YcfA (HicA-like mRNA interferase family)
MKALSAIDFIKIIKGHGFVLDRQAKGSHELWFNPKTHKRVIVPNHGSKDIPKPTLNKMIKQSGLDKKVFS